MCFNDRFTKTHMLLDMTQRLLPIMEDMDTTREMLVMKDTAMALIHPSAKNMLTDSATKSHSINRRRFLVQYARLLLTQPTLRSVKTLSLNTVRRQPRRSTNILLLLVMTPK